MQRDDVVVVTGAGRRIGAALVSALLADGHVVLGSYRRMSDQVAALQAQGALMVQADLASDAGVQAFAAEVRVRARSLRALIHNASIWHGDAEMAADVALRDATFQLHVFAPHHLNEVLTDLLLAGEGMRDIIHMTDANVPHGKADRALYLASKAALENLVKSHARRLAPRVKVNAIAPGLILFHPQDDTAYRQARLARSLVGIEPGVGVVVESVRYVLANPYVDASVLTLDGGRSCANK